MDLAAFNSLFNHLLIYVSHVPGLCSVWRFVCIFFTAVVCGEIPSVHPFQLLKSVPCVQAVMVPLLWSDCLCLRRCYLSRWLFNFDDLDFGFLKRCSLHNLPFLLRLHEKSLRGYLNFLLDFDRSNWLLKQQRQLRRRRFSFLLMCISLTTSTGVVPFKPCTFVLFICQFSVLFF
jgi:hypothetical protein